MRRINIPALYLILAAALVVAAFLAMLAGGVSLDMFCNPDAADIATLKVRFARVLLAIIAGAGLSVAGVIFQALLRNPLADPYVLGVSSGAGLGAVAAIVFGLTALWAMPISAFVGAVVTILLVYFLARTAGGAIPVHTLLLSGVIVGTVFGSILMFLVNSASFQQLRNAIGWLLGNLQILDWPLLAVTSGIVVAGLLVTLLYARDLNLFTLGEQPAAHLGLHVERTKKTLLVLASLMTGATVAACGIIGFVGLIIPHTVRLAVGPDHRRLIPASALIGAIFLLAADAVARNLLATEIPIGVITALLGGPFFLVLLRRRKRAYGS